jgi:hypothetical protein
MITTGQTVLQTITTGQSQIKSAVRSKVYRADTLGSDWEEVPYLYVDDLAIRAAPGIDDCRLTYLYGSICHPGETEFEQFEPLDLVGSYLKVLLEGANVDGDDVTWYGLVEIDDTTPLGSGPQSDEPRGRQRFTAFGLLRLLERSLILSSQIDASQATPLPTQAVMVEYGEQFNELGKANKNRQGNRAEQTKDGSPTAPYWFSRTITSNSIWTADDAVRYLLATHPPRDGNDDPVCDWVLDGDPGDTRLSWYDPLVATDGRTVKTVLDELIPYRRGVSYAVRYDETPGLRGRVTVVPFSFASEDLTLPDDRVLPANAQPVTLDFENALDVEARIVESVTTSYDEVVAMGKFATSTCTLAFGRTAFQRGSSFLFRPDWTNTQEQAYRSGASGRAGYSSLALATQYEANTRYRQRDDLRPVFRRWSLYEYWDGLVWDYEQDESVATKYSFNPPWYQSETTGYSARDSKPRADPIQPFAEKNEIPHYAASRLVFEPYLPFQDQGDYTSDRIAKQTWQADLPDGLDPQYLPPLLYTITDNSTVSAPRYDVLHRLAEQSSNERQRRRWSATLRVLPDRPAVEVDVHGAPQHFLTADSVGTIVGLEPYNDPSKESGIQFEQMRATLTLRLPWRVQQRKKIRDTVAGGRPWRQLVIPVDARLDYVVPDTVVRISDGRAERSTGGFVRDDRLRLSQIVEAACRWYQTERQTLFFRIRGVVETVTLGQLITSVGGRYTLEGINTPVTGIRYDLVQQVTELETSLAQVDFA